MPFATIAGYLGLFERGRSRTWLPYVSYPVLVYKGCENVLQRRGLGGGEVGCSIRYNLYTRTYIHMYVRTGSIPSHTLYCRHCDGNIPLAFTRQSFAPKKTLIDPHQPIPSLSLSLSPLPIPAHPSKKKDKPPSDKTFRFPLSPWRNSRAMKSRFPSLSFSHSLQLVSLHRRV